MPLKTDYKNYIPPEGGVKYQLETTPDGKTAITDVTEYLQEGDQWAAGIINDTNKAVNETNQAVNETISDINTLSQIKADKNGVTVVEVSETYNGYENSGTIVKNQFGQVTLALSAFKLGVPAIEPVFRIPQGYGPRTELVVPALVMKGGTLDPGGIAGIRIDVDGLCYSICFPDDISFTQYYFNASYLW